MRKDVRAVTSSETLQIICQFKKVKISGEILRNGGKRAGVNRTKFAIPATRGEAKVRVNKGSLNGAKNVE